MLLLDFIFTNRFSESGFLLRNKWLMFQRKRKSVLLLRKRTLTNVFFVSHYFLFEKNSKSEIFSDSNNLAHEFHACAKFITKQLRHGSVMYYWTYPYSFPVLVLEIEPRALSQVL